MDHSRGGHEFEACTSNPHPWAIVLAGGEGTRLRSLTHRIVGDSRPKQFCRIFGGKTLLRQTCDRIEPLFRRDRTMFVVTRAHAPFYLADLSGTDDTRILVQPQNRGTGVAITAALLRVLEAEPGAIVALFPSDHYYSNDQAFQFSVESALRFAHTYTQSIILLGAEAQTAEVEYGWIEPGPVLATARTTHLLRVNRFWEKPSLVQARALLHAECLWNTFVTIGSAGAFLDLLTSQIPDVVGHVSASLRERGLEMAYEGVRAVDFSLEVLTPQADRLLVLRDAASGWADLGNPSRVIDTLVRNRIEADWLDEMLVTQHG